MTDCHDRETPPEVSLDHLFCGDLLCRQHRHGYRFSVDAVLLAHFVDPGKCPTILDLGTGCGIIPLILSYRHGHQLHKVIAIEAQQGLAQLAKENLEQITPAKTCSVIHGDVQKIAALVEPESFDGVVCNPPYYPVQAGRGCSRTEADLARHEVLGRLEDFLAAAAFAVKNRGRVYLVYPAERSVELLVLASRQRLQAKKVQYIYSYPDDRQNARLLLLECVKNGGSGVEILAPFHIYRQKNGAFSEQMEHLYAPNRSDR